MTAIGYVSILAGALLLRQVFVGRATSTVPDIRNMLSSALHGDFSGISQVTSQRPSVPSGGQPVTVSPAGSPPGTSLGTLGTVMHALGDGKPYVFGASGPDSYDCSGLVWRALYDMGYYKGPRFYADQTFVNALRGKIQNVSSPEVDDIVLWSGHHMGVCVGNGMMYSALNPKDGITTSSIADNTKYYTPPVQPTYWRGSW